MLFTGKCKHVHIAEKIGIVDQQLNTHDMRSQIAREIFAAGDYEINENVVTVLHQDINSVIGMKVCTCIANSHNETCICIMVAKMAIESNSMEEEMPPACGDNSVANVEEQAMEPACPEVEQLKDSTCNAEKFNQMLNGLSEFAQTGGFDTHPKKKDIFYAVKNAYLTAMRMHTSRLSKARTIHVNHVARRKIEWAKRERIRKQQANAQNNGNCRPTFQRVVRRAGKKRNPWQQ